MLPPGKRMRTSIGSDSCRGSKGMGLMKRESTRWFPPPGFTGPLGFSTKLINSTVVPFGTTTTVLPPSVPSTALDGNEAIERGIITLKPP